MKTKLVAAQFLAILFTCGACASAIATEAEENVTFNSATVTLAKAVEIAEKNGGRTIGAEFDIEKGQPVWEIKILNTGGVIEYKINGKSGEVVKVENEHIRGKLTTFMTGLNLKDLDAGKISLAKAVEMAEKKFGGKAVKVQVEHEHGKIQYDVFVRANDKKNRMKVDSTTGQIS